MPEELLADVLWLWIADCKASTSAANHEALTTLAAAAARPADHWLIATLAQATGITPGAVLKGMKAQISGQIKPAGRNRRAMLVQAGDQPKSEKAAA